MSLSDPCALSAQVSERELTQHQSAIIRSSTMKCQRNHIMVILVASFVVNVVQQSPPGVRPFCMCMCANENRIANAECHFDRRGTIT
jgi:hypothetical protein